MKKKLFQANASAISHETFQRNSGARALGLTGFLAAMTLASSSLASPTFPNELRGVAEMTCTPSCTLCHNVDPGVSGTADKPFAVAMVEVGLFPMKPETVAVAYAALADTQDTDADGTPDKQELEDQMNLPSDPNNGDSALGNGPTICAGEVLYGCGAQIATSKEPQPFAVWSLLLAVGGGVVWRLRRGRSVTKLKN